jgi:uncharacterized protein
MPVGREQVLSILGAQRETLRQRFGVRDVALFGSVARDQATAGSDVDVLVEFDRPITLFDLAAVQQFLATTLGVSRVDVVPRDCLYPELESNILSGAIHVR